MASLHSDETPDDFKPDISPVHSALCLTFRRAFRSETGLPTNFGFSKPVSAHSRVPDRFKTSELLRFHNSTSYHFSAAFPFLLQGQLRSPQSPIVNG